MAEKQNITTETAPEAIQADIAETREEISGTVGAIRERLSPERLKGQAKNRLRESTIGRVKDAASRLGERAKGTGSTLLNSVKRDPVPVAMMSIGIAWLLINRARHAGNGEAFEYHEPAMVSGSDVRGSTEDIAGKAREKASELSEQAREKAGEFSARGRETAEQLSRTARERAERATNRLQEMIENHPLAITSAVFAIGTALGLTIPASRKEREVMGSASDTLIEKAKATAQDTMKKAQQAADKGIQAAKEEFT